MIRVAETHELEEVAKYAFKLNKIKEFKCKAFPTDYEKILAQFTRMDNHPYDKLLISTDGINLSGVLALTIEPEASYLEATGGVFAANNYKAIAIEFFNYIKEAYRGYQFDAAYPIENKQAINFMETIGAKLLDYDYEMKTNKDKYKYKKISETYEIIELSENYYQNFVNVHDKYCPNVYWTGNRLLDALDKFDIFIALEKEEVVGSIVISKFNKEFREIYLMAVAEDKRYKGYEIALVNKAVDNAFINGAKEIIVMVASDNIDEINLFMKLGFEKSDTCLTYTINI